MLDSAEMPRLKQVQQQLLLQQRPLMTQNLHQHQQEEQLAVAHPQQQPLQQPAQSPQPRQRLHLEQELTMHQAVLQCPHQLACRRQPQPEALAEQLQPLVRQRKVMHPWKQPQQGPKQGQAQARQQQQQQAQQVQQQAQAQALPSSAQRIPDQAQDQACCLEQNCRQQPLLLSRK